MRKIKTSTLKQIEIKKNRRNKYFLGFGLIILMFFSTLGYSFIGKSDNNHKGDNILNYNNFKFINQNKHWILNTGNSNFIFKYNPQETGKINYQTYEIRKLDNYYNKPLYIYSKNNEVKQEIYRNLFSVVQRMQDACLDKENCNGDFPLKTCEDNFIIIQVKNDSEEIIQNKSCVFIKGPEENLTKITDEFLFNVLGIK